MYIYNVHTYLHVHVYTYMYMYTHMHIIQVHVNEEEGYRDGIKRGRQNWDGWMDGWMHVAMVITSELYLSTGTMALIPAISGFSLERVCAAQFRALIRRRHA